MSRGTQEQLAVLIAGHVEEDAALWVQELRHGGFDVSFQQVTSEAALRAELAHRTWDVLLAGHTDPELPAPQVAHVLRELCSDIPLVAVGESDLPAREAGSRHALAHDTLVTAERGGLTDAIKNAFGRVPALGWGAGLRGHKDDQRFRKMADQAPVMLWMTDATGKCVFLNQRWAEFRGRPLGDELGNGWMDGIHPDDQSRCLKIFTKTLAERENFSFEYRLQRWDGDYRWLLDTGVAQFDREGEFVGFIGSCVDITDRRRWEEGLRQRDRLLDAVAGATNQLLASDDLERVIPETLRTLGEAMNADRAYLFEHHLHPQTGIPLMTQRHEWCRPGVAPQIDNPDMQALPYDPTFTRLLKLLQGGRSYSGIVRDFPDSERFFLEAQKIRSLLCVPVHTRDRLWGFIGFDDCHSDRLWATNDEALLSAMAGSIGAAIARRQTEMQLRARDRLLRGVASATHELLTATSFDTGIRRALQTLGTAADVERAYLFENFTDAATGDRRMKARYLWERAPSRPEPDVSAMQALSYDQLFPRWHEILSSGQPISGRILDFFKAPEADRLPPLRSILLVPVMSEDRFWGIIGFDDSALTRVWVTGDESILNAVAGSIGGAIVRKRAEDNLRASEEHFRSLIENASDIIAVLTFEGRIQYISPSIERALGHRPDQLLNRRAQDFLHPDDAPGLLQARDVLLQQPEAVRTAEFRLRRQDGSWHFFEGVAKIVDDREERRFVVNARDITERRRTEDALRHSEELLRHSQKMEAVGRLAGGVAHDFNNLLTAIMGYGELILGQLASGHELRHEAEEICKAADRAHALTRQLLAFSRKQVLEPKVTNLNTVVADMEKLLHRLIGEDIDLSTELDPNIGMVKVDPGQIEQVVINLAVNARDAMPHGGQLTIATAATSLTRRLSRGHVFVEPGRYVTIAVRDTGKGMDDYVQAHLFEPFFTTKEVGKGTGLGLSMVYGIVEQSGGHIMFDSAPGQGTTFTIYLPQVDVTPAAPAARPGKSSARGTETILLVEDEDIVRDLARHVLAQHGYTVLPAHNGPEALRIMEQRGKAVDLLLTDIVMPHFNGQSLAQRLRDKFPGLRVMFMSGYAEDAFQSVGEVSGQVNFLQKPFTPSALVRKVRDVLDAR